MKHFTALLILITCGTFAQEDIYPLEDYYGSGIGYSPIFILFDYSSIAALDDLGNLSLDHTAFSKPFIIHGGEGFAHLSGHWRLGGYAGIGGSQISTLDTASGINKSIDAALSLTLGAATIEYAIPIFRDMEISGGILMGLGRVNLQVSQSSGSSDWSDQFTVVYGSAITVPHSTDLSAVFFSLQPYLSVKWQILNRVGFRLSAGYNSGTVAGGRWYINGREPISNSPESMFQGLAIRSMLYFGL